VRAALTIAHNDLRRRLRDRSAVLVAVVVPLALASIFSLTLADVSSGEVTFEYGLVDEDRGDGAQAFREALAGVDAIRLVPEPEAASVRFVVPGGFSEALVAGRPVRIEVVGDVDEPLRTLVARSVAEGYGAEVTAVRASVAAALGTAPGGAADALELAERAAEVASPITLEDVSAQQRELEPTTFYAAGMAVFFLFFTVQLGISSLLEERRDGTLARLLAAPVRRGSILAAKTLTSIVIGVVSMSVLVLATSLLLGAEWGDPVGVAVLVTSGVLAATAVTALVASLARTQEQAGNWQSIVALVLGMLGGAFFPVSQAGGLLATLSLATPHAWFLRGLGDLSAGEGPGSVLGAAGAMLLFAGIAGGLAVLRIGRLVRP
jgi:ABC-2 type transport system permease protein